MSPRGSMVMAAAGAEGAGWELLLSPAPLKGCGTSPLPLPFAPRPEALVSGCKAELCSCRAISRHMGCLCLPG